MDQYLPKLNPPLSTCRCAWGPIQTVTMPSQGQDWEAGSNARVSGWGTLSSGGSSPDTLQAVNVPVVSDEDCADAYGNDMDGPTMICAGEEGKDSCQGDSGGPMTCGENDDGTDFNLRQSRNLYHFDFCRTSREINAMLHLSPQTRFAASSPGAVAAPSPDTPASTPRPPLTSTGASLTPASNWTDDESFDSNYISLSDQINYQLDWSEKVYLRSYLILITMAYGCSSRSLGRVNWVA